MRKHLLVLSVLVTNLGMSGCGQSLLDTHDARCPFTDRGGCQSMEMVHRMVTQKSYTPDGQFVQQAPMIQNAPRMGQLYK